MIPPTPQQFLNVFFGPGNEFSLSDFAEGKRWEDLVPLVNRIKNFPPKMTVLPRHHLQQTDIYALAFDFTELFRLREELLAFIGPSFSNFTGRRLPLRPDDPIDNVVEEFTGGKWLRTTVSTDQIKKLCGESKKNWPTTLFFRHIINSRPGIGADPKGLSSMLSDFRIAVAATDASQAWACFTDLRQSGALDEANLLFLEVELLDGLGKTRELITHKKLHVLIKLEPPEPVIAALWASIYREELLEFEDSKDPSGALKKFQGTVLQLYSTLWDRLPVSTRPDVVLLRAILAVSRGDIYPHELEKFSQEKFIKLLGTRGQYLKDLLCINTKAPIEINTESEIPNSELSSTDSLEGIKLASKHLEMSQYDDAYLVAVEETPGLERTKILLACSAKLGDNSVDRDAWKAVQELDSESHLIIEKLIDFKRLHSAFAHESNPPSDWIEWLSKLGNSKHPQEYSTLARRGQDVWDPLVLSDTNYINLLVSKIQEGPPPGCIPEFLAAIAMMFIWLQRYPDYPSIDAQLKISMANVLLNQGTSSPTQSQLDISLDLLCNAVTVANTGNQHNQVLELATNAVISFTSFGQIDWMLDLLDSLSARSKPAFGQDAIQKLADAVIQRATALIRRLTITQHGFIKTLCLEMKIDTSSNLDLYVPTQTIDHLGDLDNTIAIYTLDEAQANRAKKIVEQRSPKVKITLLHGTVNSKSLEKHARTSDLVVVVTRCATHAATGAIESARGSKPLVRPKGRGATSIVNAIEQWAANKN